MTTFDFSVVARGLDPEAEDFEQHFYDAGCDDATIGFQRGRIVVDFSREAESFDAAVASAVEAVRAAGAEVLRVEPDPLVNLSDIAARVDMSRAAMTQYSRGQRGAGFPPPVAKVTTNSPLWDWSAVSVWLHESGKLPAEAVVAAAVLKRANELLPASGADLHGALAAAAAEAGARFASARPLRRVG